ncbi:regulator of chromosome condensation-like [Patiria miniata]|uniref:RCC1-like domain-containing protein n=1 Tax=Patiria miniata TaxID=46514 RepID=A0A914A170_PATMI|nr:regulator of chromosome condensation-like [Patiria miniata]XP_038057577.1 regulator of chromosome condensation-like [Patiria miniata]XP_038057578.1 regulator of chromosome condensation-like [Patiria miniata]XP_038057580.1 regulator of chromosome condensation-like [Patiria miniata]
MPPKRKLAVKNDKKQTEANGEPTPPKKSKAPSLTHPSHRTQEGHVFALGQGDVGQLGLGEEVYERKKPTLVPLPEGAKGRVVEAIAGGMHTVCLTSAGEIYTFGCNDEGTLGHDTNEEGSEFTPFKVDLAEKVVQVSCGDSHTAALTQEGKVYMWGTFRDCNGPFGLTSEGMEKLPVQILLKKTVVKISSGNDHLCMLTEEGEIYSLGSGEQGQLGRIAEIFAVRGGRKGTGILHEPALVYCRRIRGHGKVLFDNVWCTAYGTFASMKGGGIYGWGLNNYHQLGLEDTKSRFMPEQIQTLSHLTVKDIRGGDHHTAILDTKGKVYSIGRTDYGRLGLGDGCKESYKPAQVTTLDAEEVESIGCGSSMTVCSTKKGDVYTWGMGSSLQLGTGEEDDELSPVKVVSKQLENRKALTSSGGGQHTIILARDS